MAILVDGPDGIPGDFPGMAIGIGNIASEAAMRRFVRRPEQNTAYRDQPFNQRNDMLPGVYVMREGKGCRRVACGWPLDVVA